jgi:hypothetical protein
MSRSTRIRLLTPLVCALSLSGAACASAGRIAEYDFRDRTIAVVAIAPPRPYVDTGGDVDLTGMNPVGAILKVGTSIYKESQAGQLRARLDSASTGMDLADRIAGAVLERSARYLGAQAIEQSREADFHIEVQVEEYGVDAREWESGARFHLKARLLILAADGREVWEGSVNEDEPVNSQWFHAGSMAADVVTGRALGQLTVDQLVEALESIADYSSYRLTEKLREGIEKARGDG